MKHIINRKDFLVMSNKNLLKLFLLMVACLGLVYLAYFGIGKDGYGAAENTKLGIDLNGGLSITFETEEENPDEQELNDTIYKLSQRVQKYSTEASVYKEGDRRINVEIPLKETSLESAKTILDDLGTPGTLEFQDADGNIIITGADVKSAEAGTMQNDAGLNSYMVKLKLTDEGAKKFTEGTLAVSQKASGSNYIAIIFDGEVISAPRCEKQIDGDEVVVENMESFKAADKLAAYIRIGAIPLKLNTIRSSILAPQLGSNAIKTSLMAAFIGICIIMAFMIFVYRIPGFCASLALVMYVSIVLFVVSAFEITLTLPGIAGIILSIGMAVDANVIIFTRIKEEIGAGNSVDLAIKTGFDKAFWALMDGNVTTLIATAILYALGTGPIKGFAATLAIGIIVSLFTALTVTKFIVKLFYALGAKAPGLYGSKKDTKIFDFIGRKKIFFAISIIAILAGFGIMGYNASQDKGAFNFGIEFAGGSSTTVTFKEELSQDKLESDVVPLFEEVIGKTNVQIQKVDNSAEVVFKTRELTADENAQISAKLVEKYGVDKGAILSDNIGSSVSGKMRRDAIISVIVSTIAMLIYIWIRFRKFEFAASAILAICHDVCVVLGFYAISRITVGNTFIACMLTLVGYTINATIVIFDRVRENMKIYASSRAHDLKDIINRSVTETFSRSVNTTFTTFIMVFMIFILGVTSIKEFALPLMVGVLVGAFSSVCITGSLLYLLLNRKKKAGN